MNNYKKRIFFFFLSSTVFLFCYCSNFQKSKNINFEVLNDSLKTESDKLASQNDSIDKLFKEKLVNEKTYQTAELWFPVACFVLHEDEAVYKYIDQSINTLNTASINTDSLYSHLYFLKGRILRAHPEIFNFFKLKTEIITNNLDSLKLLNNETFQSYFENKSKDEQLHFLRQVILNIRTIENEILLFCYNKVKQKELANN